MVRKTDFVKAFSPISYKTNEILCFVYAFLGKRFGFLKNFSRLPFKHKHVAFYSLNKVMELDLEYWLNLSLYSLYYAEACNELAGPIS